jgi:hypothetical protein
MKDFLDTLADFFKKLMQPAITIAVVIVFIGFSLSGRFNADQVWQIVVGVILFWFGYTAFKFGTGNDTPATKTTTDLTDVVATQSQDLATSVPAPVVKAILEKINAPTVTTTTATGSTVANGGVSNDPDPDAYLKEIS